MQLTHRQKEKHFFLNAVKRTVSYFAVSLLTIIFFFSCTIQPDVRIVFTITKGGQEIDTKASSLLYDNNYLLTVGIINDVTITTTTTTDYHITYEPAGAFTTISQTTNSLSFTVNAGHTTATFTAVHRRDTTITETLIVNLKSPDTPTTDFARDIQGTTVPNLAGVNQLTWNVLGPLRVSTGTPMEKRYATESGAGSYNGTSWANAWAATNLKNGINAINDATANKVYLIMVAGGTYKPSYILPVDRTISFSMKNYVAIMGGFEIGGGWARTGTTIFSGDIGTAGDTTDNSYHVFSHNTLTLENALLYGVTITGGNTSGGSDSQQLYGGGMHNERASPMLTSVVFSNNNANRGGGMHNVTSSPNLINTRFVNNTAALGGGMHNNSSSAPVLNGALFTENNAQSGGGMYNSLSSPEITMTVFNSNVATDKGGGMYNSSSSPVIIGTVFRGNHDKDGAGIFIDSVSSTSSEPRIINTIFSDNTTNIPGIVVRSSTSATSIRARGPDIAVDRSGNSAVNIHIAGTVLGIGQAKPTNAIVSLGTTVPLNINYHSLANGAVNFGADATFTVYGISFPYPTITAGSSAINLGLNVKRDASDGNSGITYYFSKDNTTWYSSFSATGGFSGSTGSPHISAIDLTAMDIAGNPRVGRPDAGLYELP